MIALKFLGIVCFAIVLSAGNAFSQDRKAEVVAFMDKAVAHYKAAGEEQAFKDFADKNGEFIKGELYLVMTDHEGVVVFHAANPKLVGRKLLNMKDTDGKLFVHDMVAASKAGSGWVSYKWVHPETKKIAQKHAYIVSAKDNAFLFTGYYE